MPLIPDPDQGTVDLFEMDPAVLMRKELRRRVIEEGESVTCPVCGQKHHQEVRTLYGSMVRVLLWLYNNTKAGEWVHLYDGIDKDLPNRCTGDASKLRFWELTERHETKQGHYRITEKGRRFVRGEINVPRSHRRYRGEILSWSAVEISFRDAMRTAFANKKKADAIPTTTDDRPLAVGQVRGDHDRDTSRDGPGLPGLGSREHGH